jgi:hypothetical protein
MQQSPITNKSIGIIPGWGDEKFRNVRHKAKDEEFIRKTKRNKQNKEPKFKVDDVIVISSGGIGNKEKIYLLVKIVDFDYKTCYKKRFEYYGVVLKTTSNKMIHRIGRLIKFDESDQQFYGIGWSYARIEDENIKWFWLDNK